MEKKKLEIRVVFLESQNEELKEKCSVLEQESGLLKEKVRRFDATNMDLKNLLINKTPFSSFIEGDSLLQKNAIDSFVSNNLNFEIKEGFANENDFNCAKNLHENSIDVCDVFKFDRESGTESAATKEPLESLSFKLNKLHTP